MRTSPAPHRRRLRKSLAIVAIPLPVVGLAIAALAVVNLKCYQRARFRTAKLNLAELSDASKQFIQAHARCPSGEGELVSAQLIRTAFSDPWGTPFSINCRGAPAGPAEVTVRSAGPNRQPGDDDDIVRE